MYQLVRVQYEKVTKGDYVYDTLAEALLEGNGVFFPDGTDQEYLAGEWSGYGDDVTGNFTALKDFEALYFVVVPEMYDMDIFEWDTSGLDAFEKDAAAIYSYVQNCNEDCHSLYAVYEYYDPDEWGPGPDGQGERLKPVEYRFHGITHLASLIPYLSKPQLEGGTP